MELKRGEHHGCELTSMLLKVTQKLCQKHKYEDEERRAPHFRRLKSFEVSAL